MIKSRWALNNPSLQYILLNNSLKSNKKVLQSLLKMKNKRVVTQASHLAKLQENYFQLIVN